MGEVRKPEVLTGSIKFEKGEREKRSCRIRTSSECVYVFGSGN